MRPLALLVACALAAGLLGSRVLGTSPALSASAGQCHQAYPEFCIPPPPPDLDCPDIGRHNFTVLPPDPHRFDLDRDGIGCER